MPPSSRLVLSSAHGLKNEHNEFTGVLLWETLRRWFREKSIRYVKYSSNNRVWKEGEKRSEMAM